MTVLVAYDGSRPAQEAVEHAVTRYADEEIVLLRVLEVSSGMLSAGVDMFQEWLKTEREEVATELAEEIEDLIDAADVEFRMETAVGEPAREFDGLRPHPGGVDRGRGVRRVTPEPEPREVEVLAVVLDRLARQHLLDDVDRLAGSAKRVPEVDPVPVLDDDRAGGAEAQPEAAVGDLL